MTSATAMGNYCQGTYDFVRVLVMKTNKQVTELQASYEAMVESVEAFVMQEGKTLQQAFLAAEQKLEDAKDISREKI
jgi:hypothetical protein